MTFLASLESKYRRDWEIVCRREDDEEKWFAARRTCITASMVPAVLGTKPGRVRYWYELRGKLQRNGDTPEYAQLGGELEDTIAALYTKRSGRKVERVQTLVRSRRYPWLGCTLDFLHLDVDEPAPLEIKTTGNGDNWPFDGEAALPWQQQLQAQLLILNGPWGALAALLGSPTFALRTRDYLKHKRFHDILLERTESFWKSLSQDVPPVELVDNSEETYDAVRALQVLCGQRTLLDTEHVQHLQKWKENQALATHYAELAQHHKNIVATRIGEAEFADLPDGTELRFKTQNRDGYTVEPMQVRVLTGPFQPKPEKKTHEKSSESSTKSTSRAAARPS